jgi:hypothetical protein
VVPSTNYKSWDKIFSNTQTVSCPITSCAIYKTGSCGVGTFDYADEIYFSGLELKALKTIKTGYSHQFCVICSNGFQSAQLEWKVTQGAEPVIPNMPPQFKDILYDQNFETETGEAFTFSLP